VEPQWARWIQPFLAAAQARKFPVHAWVVLNHRDYCPPAIHDLCTRNIHGDIYSWSLCPSNTEIRHAFAELCRQTEAFGGFAGLQLEGIGYLGYAHNSLHDKAGIALAPEEIRHLSICNCSGCRTVGLPDPVAVQQDELRLIREAVTLPLCLRTAASNQFIGGKSSLTASQARGYADSLSLTFFGQSPEAMRREMDRFSREDFEGPVYGGFVFHGPDCANPDEFAHRDQLLGNFDGRIYYCAGMAAEEHWATLRSGIGTI